MSKDYYESQLKKLKNFENITFQLTDYDGNKTNNMSLNKESLQALNELFLGLQFAGLVKVETKE